MQVRAHRLEELELLLTLVSLLLGFRAPGLSKRVSRISLRRLRLLGDRPVVSMLLVAGLPLALRFLLLPWVPVPQPQIQEEFSYLLGADTFAHGRLANPTHPMGFFFDNIQLIMVPHYASARPPGQTLFLWFGQIVFHLPWMGVCLSVGAMCAAFYWMLLAWAPPPWALLAALLFSLRFGIFTYWMNSYWGGAAIALGGALVLGALPRILTHSRLRDAVWYAIGCCLLASTRPYEGLAYVLPTAILLTAWWTRSPDRKTMQIRSLRILAPIVLTVGAMVGWFAFYNLATTGRMLQTAYGLWREQQGVVPGFWWQPLRRVPVYFSPQVREFNAVWEVAIYNSLHRSRLALLSALAWRLMQFLQLYIRPLLLIPLLVGVTGGKTWDTGRQGRRAVIENALWVGSGLLALLLGHSLFITGVFLLWGALRIFRGRHEWRKPFRDRFCLGPDAPILLLFAGGACAMLTTFSMPTYYAHFTAPAFVLIALGMRSVAAWRRTQGIGRAVVINLSLCSCLMVLVSATLSILHGHVVHESPFNWSTYENGLEERAAIQSFLDRQPGKQLAMVRYGPGHDVLNEWVWNLADIDRQKTVWARDSKPEWNQQLVRYFSGRRVWLVEPESGTVRPYPLSTLPETGEPPPQMSVTR
ncbi:MAG TPA: hypothetical protein VGR96_13800 [Acidobacteriaceae bacterium]|nr:hypothetical protein [Acidobacteriaceae bacterium]